jgi:hypothetical protein
MATFCGSTDIAAGFEAIEWPEHTIYACDAHKLLALDAVASLDPERDETDDASYLGE